MNLNRLESYWQKRSPEDVKKDVADLVESYKENVLFCLMEEKPDIPRMIEEKLISQASYDFFQILKKILNSEIQLEYVFPKIQNGRKVGYYKYDCYVEQFNLLIEFDGKNSHETEKQKKRDLIKKEVAKKHGYNFIRIPFAIPEKYIYSKGAMSQEQVDKIKKDYQSWFKNWSIQTVYEIYSQLQTENPTIW